jgi:pimeloyl-ACP methyl ester carboxylesterase
MQTHDDELKQFEMQGAVPLPNADHQGYIEHDGVRIWYAAYSSGAPVILLHGGLGHGGNWGYQVPALIESGYRAIVLNSRGHGHSTRDERPYSYDLMAADVAAVMDKCDAGLPA